MARPTKNDVKEALQRIQKVFGVPSWYQDPQGTLDIWWEKLRQYSSEAIENATESSLTDEARFPNLPAFIKRVRLAEAEWRANAPPPVSSFPGDERTCQVCGTSPEDLDSGRTVHTHLRGPHGLSR